MSEAKIKLFGKWECDIFDGDVEKNSGCDMALLPYLVISREMMVPHTSGRYAVKRFKKIECHIVERLTNSMMMNGRNNGKKMLAIKIVKDAFDIIYLLTKQNPLEVLLQAICNCGAREDTCRVGSVGTVRRQAVDVSPLRRINQALALITIGSRTAAFRSVKSISECLAEELINASKSSISSYAIRKKDELERVAKLNR